MSVTFSIGSAQNVEDVTIENRDAMDLLASVDVPTIPLFGAIPPDELGEFILRIAEVVDTSDAAKMAVLNTANDAILQQKPMVWDAGFNKVKF